MKINPIDLKVQKGGDNFLGRFIDHELTYGRHIIRNFLRKIPEVALVVDIGAGYGDDLDIARTVFPDSSLNAIECGNNFFETLQSKNINIHRINIEKAEFPFDDNSVDLYMANNVLEHTKEIFWIFHEITRSLKTGGHVIIGLPNIAALHNRLIFLFGRQPTQLKSRSAHVRGFTPRDFRNFINVIWPAGYSIVDFKGSQFYPFPKATAKILSSIFPSLAFSMFFLLKKNGEYNDEFIKYPVISQLETPYFIGENCREYQYTDE